MKKQLVSLFAMASMVFASSCTSEEIISQSTGNEVAVTFTANLRNDVKSRAVGDDTDNVDQLVFAVYDKNGKELPELRQSTHVQDDDAKKAITLTDNGVMKEAKIEVVLVKGQTYSFAFWAQKNGHAAYSFDPETAKVEISYQNTNDKAADAFFASVTNHKVTGTFEKNVTLKRPFAQINFLTTAEDLRNAAKSEFTPSQSQIVVKNAATELNVLDGTVAGDTDVTFGLAGLVGHDLDNANADERAKIKNGGQYVGFTNTGTFPLVGTEDKAEPFIYLATAYFLPTVPTASTEIDASVLVKATGKDDYELAVTKVNAQRNYRTNIYGNLLTSNGTFYVTVDPGFVDDYSYEEKDETTKVVGTIEEANDLFAKGETNVTITEAPEASANVELPNTTESVTINFAFENPTDASTTITVGYKSGASEKPAHVDINGNENVIGSLVIDVPGSTATVNVGEYTNVTATTKANTLYVPKGVKIGTLTLKQGNAEIYYGTVTNLVKEKGYNGTITWTVDSKEQLVQIATDVNSGNTFAKQTIALISDIDLNNEEWNPIGNSTNRFQGIFDGQEHIISNLSITGNKSYVGLFGYTTNGGESEIKNLTVNNAKVSGYLGVGVVVGSPYTSKYTNIKVTGHVEVNGFAYVGGVGGRNAYANWTDITIDVDASSYVKANSVENGTAYRTYVGGVVGFNGEGGHSFTNIKSNINVSGSTCDVGGLFGIAHYGNKFVNCSSSANVEITDATEAGDAEEIGGIAGVWNNGGSDVEFTGCSFTGTLKANITEGVDLSDNTITGKAYSANGTGKLIIDGVTNISVSGQDALAEALGNGVGVVELASGTYTFPANSIQAGTVINCKEGVVFEGSSSLNIKGATVNGAIFSNLEGNAVGGTINGTFQDCKFTGNNALRYTYAGETVVFENCVFDGSVYGVHFDGGANDVVFRNCIISGFNALGGALTMVTFEGCTFKSNGKSGYNGANLWGSAKMINCEFTFDGTTTNEWIDCIGADKTYEFTNCTVNGTKYTADNYTEYEDIFSRNGVTVKINGVDCTLLLSE